MSKYINSNTYNNISHLSSSNKSSSYNSENFNTLRSKKQSSSSFRRTPNTNKTTIGKSKTTRKVLGDISNNGYTPKFESKNGSKTSMKTDRKILGNISNQSNLKKNDNGKYKSSSTFGTKTSKKASAFKSSSFILEDKTNEILAESSSNFQKTSARKKSNTVILKNVKRTTNQSIEKETSIFVDNNTKANLSQFSNSKIIRGDINTKSSNIYESDDGSVSSIELPAGRMWHEQHFSDDEDDLRIDIQEIKNDINEIKAQQVCGTHQKTDFEEYEAKLREKMEELLFSHDPSEGKKLFFRISLTNISRFY